MGRGTIKRGVGKKRINPEDFHLADEIEYVRSCAANCDARLVIAGALVLFSTEAGDAWLLDPADSLAARVARDGDPEDVCFEESDTGFAILWKGHYQIDGDIFRFIDCVTGRVTMVPGLISNCGFRNWFDGRMPFGLQR